ncbi:MAG: dTDP-glucose 4,6-dehydratase [Anaerolineales bacterium]|nr:dTDP-glucose 4,6-dehydratase [Anaerolineales bacterium]
MAMLVTGGAGFIGSNFIRRVLSADPKAWIVDLDLLTYAGTEENLKDLPDGQRHSFVRGDIGDRALLADLLRRHRIDTIVHFAAETHVDRSLADPSPFFRTNVMGTLALLEAARGYWIREKPFPLEAVRFHHISTDEVFGSLSPEDPPFSETSPYAPSSPYAASKAAADHLVRAYFRSYGLPVTITHCSNNYGPRQFPEKLVALTIANALRGEPIPVYGDGGQIRDWLYVEDHCEAVRAVLARGKPGAIYLIGGGNQLTNLSLVEKVCGLMDELLPKSVHRPHAKLISPFADRPGHDRRYALDGSKIQRELGWSSRETLDSGLRKTVKWYRANPAWMRAVLGNPGHREWIAAHYGRRGNR